MPGNRVPADLQGNVRSYYQALTARMDKAIVTKAGFEFRSPNLTVFDDGRAALQACCFGAVFFGAAKASFPLQGELLRQWNGLIQRRGDEFTKDKVRDHGSSKSLALWMNRGLATTNPGSCNTFVAASAKVS